MKLLNNGRVQCQIYAARALTTVLGAVPATDMLVDDTVQPASENGDMRPLQPGIQEDTGDKTFVTLSLPSIMPLIACLPIEALGNGKVSALQPAYSTINADHPKPWNCQPFVVASSKGAEIYKQANALLADPLPGGRGPREELKDRYTPPGWLISR